MKQHVPPRRLAKAVASVLAIALLLAALLGVALFSSASGAPFVAANTRAPSNPLAAQPAAALSRVASTVSTGPARSGVSDPAAAVRGAWELARQLGAYDFGTDLVETAFPALTLSNAGNGPQNTELHLEGAVDLPARRVQVRMWQGTGNLLAERTANEARFEDGTAYVRSPGGSWQEIEDFSSTFAPNADPLGFLAGIKNVRVGSHSDSPGGSQGLLPAGIAHYAFDLDGPALAAHIRDQLEQQLRDRGELPLGLNLDVSTEFRDATGGGELWVDSRGLPVRLALHLAFPEKRDGSHAEADVRTDFSGFPQAMAARPSFANNPLAWARAALEAEVSEVTVARAVQTAGPGGAVAAGLGAIALLVLCRRSRKLYTAVVISVIASMILVPLMQSGQVAAFFEQHGANSAAGGSTERAGRCPGKAGRIDARVGSTAGPARRPPAQDAPPGGKAVVTLPAEGDSLLAPAEEVPPPESACDQADTEDPDADGVTNFDECQYLTDEGDPDSDDDGLMDGEELNRLGTDPNWWDTDSDQITDTLEVKGFWYEGQQWYLNPKNPDTNDDGQLDSMECLALTAGQTVGTNCDTDLDKIPNPFDVDNDNDGVPDRVDISPGTRLDRDGLGTQQAPYESAFNGDSPFLFSLGDLQPDWPVLVDFQVRPTIAEHLSYAMNVLDWPSEDRDGQIQHGKDTTFANSDNPDIANPDDAAGSHGDLRLIPLLELTIPGTQAPLKLADQKMVVEMRGALSATVTLTPQAADPNKSDLLFHFGQTGSHDVTVYQGDCPGKKANPATFAAIGDGAKPSYAKKLNDLANGDYALILSQGTATVCEPIPDMVTGPYGSSGKMIDRSVLDPYGITLQDKDDGSLLAYLPLSLVSDDTGGGKAAFQTRMLYWPGATNVWQEAQQVKVVWILNMLTDDCDSNGFPTWEDYHKANPNKSRDDYDEAQALHCQTHRTMDEIKPVQTYDESWFLTGLSVREDHGLDVAVAYPDPRNATYSDDALWGLSWGLGQQFLTGRDCEINNSLYDNAADDETCFRDSPRDLPDISIFKADKFGYPAGNSTISERFAYTSTVTGNSRWNVPAKALNVEDYRYDHVDYMSYLAANVTPVIVAKYDTTEVPTLLFAREERYRMATLEGGAQANNGFNIKLDESNYPERTVRGLSWAPYYYKDGEWQGFASEDYWGPLSDELHVRFWADYPTATSDEIEGRVAVARSYYMGLITGAAQSIDVTQPHHDGESDSELAGVASTAFATAAGADAAPAAVAAGWPWLSRVADDIIIQIWNAIGATKTMAVPYGPGMFVDDLGNIFWKPSLGYKIVGTGLNKGYGMALGAWQDLLSSPKAYKVAGLVIFSVAIVTAAVCLIVGLSLDKDTLTVLIATVEVAGLAQLIVGAVAEFSKAVSMAGGFGKLVANNLVNTGLTQFVGTVKANASGVVTAIISGVMAWASWGISWAMGGLQAGSMAWDETLAATIASTLVTIILFVIFNALGPLGMLIKSLISLVDALVGLICSTFLTDEQEQSAAGDLLCGGITGLIKKLVQWLIYSGAVIPEMDPDEDQGEPWYPRLTFGGMDIDVDPPDKGIIVGSKMGVSIALTNTIDMADIPHNLWAQAYYDQWNDTNLKKSNFQYKWQEAETDFHKDMELGGISRKWETSGGRPFRYKTTLGTGTVLPLNRAGINQTLSPLYLSEAYAVPEQECWGLFPFGGCGISTERASYHYDFGGSLIFDVLPNSITDFYQLAPIGGSYHLAWGNAISFPGLFDADGDTLPATTDPNDSRWDTDSDGLGDQFERTTGSDPNKPDTDGDGLTDLEEARAGTNPRLKDTDGEGLQDGYEVYHQDLSDLDQDGNTTEWLGGWEFVYGRDADGAPLITRVYSDPTSVDADGDTLTDKQENTFGYNPDAPSVLNVLTLQSEVREAGASTTDGFVKPGDTLKYTATVKNELDLRQAEGVLGTLATPLLDAAKIPQPKDFVLDALESVQQTGDLVVKAGATSGPYSLTQVAGALITDWRTGSGGTSLWLRFDDPQALYRDTSGSQPDHDGTCKGVGCTITTGRYGSALHLDGSSYVFSAVPVAATEYAVSFWFKADSTSDTYQGKLFTDEDPNTHRERVDIMYDKRSVWVSLYGCSNGSCWNDNISSPAYGLAAQEWHHVVHTYGGLAGKQKLYIDGRLVKEGFFTSTAASTSRTNIGGTPTAGLWFAGSIDDVRLYERGLTADEVWALSRQPVFHMDFEKTSGWEDVSSFHAGVAPVDSSHTPVHDTGGIQGSAAKLNGVSYLNVSNNLASTPQLDLSGGKYTIAAWVYPQKGCGFDTQPGAIQSIVSSNAEISKRYPDLTLTTDPGQSSLAAIGTGFGTGSSYQYADGPWSVPFNQWTHVVMTFDTDVFGDQGYDNDVQGTWRLYTNGKETWHNTVETSGAKPYATTYFQVGQIASGMAHSFCGKIDELVIYNHVLDADTIAALTSDGASALHLQLDEAPGSASFHDDSAAQRELGCAGSGCPGTGLAGRVNQAAQFSAFENVGNALTLGNSAVNRLTNNYSVAGWIKPSSLASRQHILATGKCSSTGAGWSFGLYLNDLRWESFGAQSHILSLSGAGGGGAQLQANRWYHVALVADAANKLTFYIDGQAKGQVQGFAATADTANRLVVGGCDTGTSIVEGLDGMLDDLWVYGTALTAEQVKALFDAAPVMQLHLEEANGATTFKDDGWPGSVATCPTGHCPTMGEGVKGQMGLAAGFINPAQINVPYNAGLNTPKFTIGGWLRPDAFPPDAAPGKRLLMAKGLVGQEEWKLWLNTTQSVNIYRSCSNSSIEFPSEATLLPEQWNYVLVTYDGAMLRFYINGSESGAHAFTKACTDSGQGVRLSSSSGGFSGRMDEMVVYNRALTPNEILTLYNYQSGWIEDRNSQTIVVDNEAPTVSVVITDGVHLPDGWPVVVALDAQDASSGIQSVDLLVSKGGGAYTPVHAQQCADPAQGPAWCATFTPSGEAQYSLSAKATDRVGRTADATKKLVLVDATAPSLNLALTEGQLVSATRSATDPPMWLIHLSGTVSDAPVVRGTESGIPREGLRVTLVDAEGEALGEAGQIATIAGDSAAGSDTAWSLDYAVPDAEPDGCYTVKAEVVDNITAIPGLPEQQKALHTTAKSKGIVIDSRPPQVVLDQSSLAHGMLGAGVTSLGGETTKRPVPVEVDMTTTAGADLTGVKLTCRHGNAGSWYTVFEMLPGQLAPGSGAGWDGEIHKLSTCTLDLTTTATKGGVAGTIKVCGEALDLNPDWTGDFSAALSITFVVNSTRCLARGCTADQAVSGTQKVEVAFTPILQGSAWLNEAPLAGETLHMPFDDTPNADGSMLVRDVSGMGHTMAVDGTTAPSPGQAGQLGSAFSFDGVDDYVSIPDSDDVDFAASQDFAVMAWIKPAAQQLWTATTDNDVIEKWSGATAYPYVVRYVNSTGGANAGKISAARYDRSTSTVLTSASAINDGKFHHVAFVRNGGMVSLYVDGVLSAGPVQDKVASTTTNSSPLYIGRRGAGDMPNYFTGQVDDLRIFKQGLTADDVKTIYTGSAAQLVMAFEEPLAVGGDKVSDGSGWGRDGTLNTGSGDTANKTMPGQVGNYALKLDGVNDGVAIDNFGVFTTTTVSAWVYRTGATTGRETIVSYKEDANCGLVLALESQSPIFYVHAKGTWYHIHDTTGEVPLNEWVHFAVVQTPDHMLIFRNGKQVASGYWATIPTAMDQCAGRTGIGVRSSLDQHWFPGAVDDVRFYGRVLSANEIADLYNAGWHTTTLSAGGATVDSATWSMKVPTTTLGFEGTYRLDLRGTDSNGHTQAVSEPRHLWQGEIDNLAPRVTLCKALVSGTTYRYVAEAQDYNLVEQGFAAPCAISSRTNYQSPWLLSTIPTGDAKLNKLRADCSLSAAVVEKATACDSAGNCTTAGVTSGGACTSILASPAAMAAGVPDSVTPTTPVLGIVPTVLTTTHYSGLGEVVVTGYLTGTANLDAIEVTVDGTTGKARLTGPDTQWPFTTTWSYRWQPQAGPPDGAQFETTANAVVHRGPRIPAVETFLTVDVLPPAEVEVALTANGAPVEPGAVLRTASPQLRLAWDASRDGSGVAGYTTRWVTTSALSRTVETRAAGAGGPYEDRYQAGDAQTVAVELISRDLLGNERSQPFGAVVVDGPLTPDLVQLPADPGVPPDPEWMETGCTLLTTDGRAARISGAGAYPIQALYGSWDQAALRLTWAGADWSSDGDLFVYLDTGAGGTRDLFTPYPVPEKASQFLLPSSLDADTLVWVQDNLKASLLKWQGGGWQPAGELTASQYRFDPVSRDGETDLYLPFKLLGARAGDPIRVLALAAEEPVSGAGLQIWATAPHTNPANSARSNQRAALGCAAGKSGRDDPVAALL